jgi:glycopeptide antibiotics resistance protein
MFIPIGVFAPVLNKRYLRFFPFLGFTFLILTAIETIQLISRVGSFDVDDLILNLFGAIIGYLFLRGLIK